MSGPRPAAAAVPSGTSSGTMTCTTDVARSGMGSKQCSNDEHLDEPAALVSASCAWSILRVPLWYCKRIQRAAAHMQAILHYHRMQEGRPMSTAQHARP